MNKIRKMQPTKNIEYPKKIPPNAQGGTTPVCCPHCGHKMVIGGEQDKKRCPSCNEEFYLDGVEIEKHSWE